MTLATRRQPFASWTRSSVVYRFAFTWFRPTTEPSSIPSFTGTCRIWTFTTFTSDPEHRASMARSNGISDDIHLFNKKLREWENYYNYHRPHGALDGQTPYERLLAKTGARLSATS